VSYNKVILFLLFAFLAYANASLGPDGRPLSALGADDRRQKKDNWVEGFSRMIREEVTISDTTVRSKGEIISGLGVYSVWGIYNNYLNSGLFFSGKITLKVEIEANGSLSQVSVISSDTNNPKFNDEVKNEVKTWRISGIEKGSVTVIIPFEFRIIPLTW